LYCEKSFITAGIPEGSISHYYSIFNKNRLRYKRMVPRNYQNSPRVEASRAANEAFSLVMLTKILMDYVKAGEIGKAKDFLQLVMLYDEFSKKKLSIINQVDPVEYHREMNKLTKTLFQYLFLNKS